MPCEYDEPVYDGEHPIEDEQLALRWLWENPHTFECLLANIAKIEPDVEWDRILVAAYRCMPYDLYLKTEYWKRVTEIMKDEQPVCQLCGSRRHLNTHHRCYDHRGYESTSCLIVLCRGCHRAFHDRRNVARS